MEEHDLPPHKNLREMWAEIQGWLGQGDSSRCGDLLQYVDDLKMWGRQRIFLYDIKGNREDLTKQLSSSAEVRKLELVGAAYNKPIYRWEASELFLAKAEHTEDPDTGAPLLVLKFIETREYDVESTPHDERSVNFFIVNLRDGFAELRLQQLPTGAHRNLREERQLFEAEIARHLKLKRFSHGFTPIQLEPIMGEILRTPTYAIKSTEFVAGKDIRPKAPTLLVILNQLFEHPMPREIAAYWECVQDVLGKRRLHFTLLGSNDHLAFGGIADPCMINDILRNVVNLSRGQGIAHPRRINDMLEKMEGTSREKESTVSTTEPPPTWVQSWVEGWGEGWVDETCKNLEGHPKAQAFVLSTGIIAASVIWIVMEGIGNYLLEGWVESILHGVPLIAFTMLINLAFIWRFYGWRRIKRSFQALWNIPPSKIWKIVKKARRKGNKLKHGVDGEDQDEESEDMDLAEPEDDD
jgi:hypothetical protein